MPRIQAKQKLNPRLLSRPNNEVEIIVTSATVIKTTGSIWNQFYADKAAWPEGAYHDDTLLVINGKEDPDAEFENLAMDSTVEIRCGCVFFPDGTDADLGEHLTKWLEEQSGLGVAMGSFRAPKDKLQAVRLAILAAGGELIE